MNGTASRDKELAELGLHPARQFCAIVDRELALVARNGHAFSLLVFDVSEYVRDGRKMRAFAQRGALRLRKTDMMGWLNEQHAGMLLPFTSFQGARHVADDIVTGLARDGMQPAYTVHTYPSDHVGEAPSAQRGARSVGKDGGETAGSSGGAATPLSAPDAVRGPDRPAPEQDLKALVIPPFPRWKRAMDIVFSLLLLVLASPLMLLIALLIKTVSPRGGVLFKQERVGFLGNRFNCLKFRSMHVNSEEAVHQRHLQHLMQSDVPMTKLDAKKDARVIPLGRLLRASGLDELPQLLNVLRGDMSLIGPRPCLEYEFRSFQHWHRMRFDTMPRLTGLWQVSGKNRTTFTQMMRLDVSYARRRSPWNDIRILFMTVPVVLKQVVDLVGAQKGK